MFAPKVSFILFLLFSLVSVEGFADCGQKRNLFVGTRVCQAAPPDFGAQICRMGPKEASEWKAFLPEVRYLFTTKKAERNLLKEVWESLDPYDRSDKVFSFINDSGDKVNFSVARQAIFDQSFGKENLVIKPIHYWQASLKFQNSIDYFIDLGWFRLLRETQNSCYWDLVSVVSLGIHLY